jgi:hypothetical protein
VAVYMIAVLYLHQGAYEGTKDPLAISYRAVPQRELNALSACGGLEWLGV